MAGLREWRLLWVLRLGLYDLHWTGAPCWRWNRVPYHAYDWESVEDLGRPGEAVAACWRWCSCPSPLLVSPCCTSANSTFGFKRDLKGLHKMFFSESSICAAPVGL